MEIFTVLKANIRHKKGAFKSIIFLMMIVSLAITTLVSIDSNITKQVASHYKKTGAGTIISYISDSKLNDDIISNVKNTDGVADVNDIKCIAADGLKINNKKSQNTLFLRTSHDNTKYPLYNTKENGYKKSDIKLKKGEIIVPIAFKIAYNCKIGSKISMPLIDGNKEFVIKGFMEDASFGAYVMGVKQTFISDEDYDDISHIIDQNLENKDKQFSFYHIFNIYKEKGYTESASALRKSIEANSGLITNAMFTMTDHEAKYYTCTFTRVGVGILTAFVILLFVIIIIVMGHSIGNSIEMEYVNLGILKSQGFTKGKIRLILMLQYIFAQIAGAVLGVIVAVPATKAIGSMFQPITGILASSDIKLLESSGIILGIIVLSVLFLLVTTRKVAKITPCSAISGGKNSVYFDSRLNVGITKKALDFKLAVRQITSDKKQYIASVLIVSILVFFMMSMTMVSGSFTQSGINEMYGGITTDVDCTAKKEISKDKIKDIKEDINKISKLSACYMSRNDYYAIDNEQYYANIYDSGKGFKSIIKGRAPKYDNEIVITEILSKEIKKKIGDKVTVSSAQASKEYIISGYYQSSNDLGKCFGMTFDSAARLQKEEVLPAYFYFNFDDKSKLEKVNKMLNDKYGDYLTSEVYDIDKDSNMTAIVDSINSITALIYFVSALIVIVIVSMSCSRAFLREKTNLGIYKAIGFTHKKLRFQFAFRFLIVAVIGSALGLLLSFLGSDYLLSKIFVSIGISNFKGSFTPFVVLTPIILICVCFTVFSYVSSRKVKKVSINELITE